MKKNKKVIIEESRCKGCQLCIMFCKQKALVLGTKINKLGYRYVVMEKPDACTGCAVCAEICPDAVIEVWREDG